MAQKTDDKKVVQGTYIPLEDVELLKAEARRVGIRHTTTFASIILMEWCKNKRIENAKQLLKDHGEAINGGIEKKEA